MYLLFLFLLGTALGSFFNVVVYRTLQDKDWVRERSECEACGKKIAWHDNIPLLSFILLRGKCRYCGQSIGLIHPLVELLTGLGLVATAFIVQGPALPSSLFSTLALAFWIIVFLVSWLIFLFDFKAMIIPDFLVILLTLLAAAKLIYQFWAGDLSWAGLTADLFSTLALVLLFLSLWLITNKKGFGLGDVKLAAPLGLLLGLPQIIVGVFSAFIIGAVWGIILIVAGSKKFGQTIAFGPFLVIGFWLSLIWGQKLWAYYWQLLSG